MSTYVRKALIKAARHAGCGLRDDVGWEFLSWTGDEIIAVLDAKDAEIARLTQRHERIEEVIEFYGLEKYLRTRMPPRTAPLKDWWKS